MFELGDKDPWLKTKKNKMSSDKLTYISVALLGKCNLDCMTCYVNGSREGLWDFDSLKKIIKDAYDLGMKNPTFWRRATSISKLKNFFISYLI